MAYKFVVTVHKLMIDTVYKDDRRKKDIRQDLDETHSADPV